MDGEPCQKAKIILLSCLENEIGNTTVEFASTGNEEIYVVSRIPLFKSYVKTLLSTSAQATVVLVYEEMDVLLELLSLIHNIYISKGGPASEQQHFEQVSTNLSSANKGAEYPLGFNVLILKRTNEDKRNHLSASEMALQQTLRFIAMKHGATYAAISEEENRTADEYGFLVNNLLSARATSQLYVYDAVGVNLMPGTTLHQLIPNGWDSWKKIALLSKSIPRETTGLLLETDEDFTSLNEAYNAIFLRTDSCGDSLKAILQSRGLLPLRKVKASLEDPLLTYSDIIAVLEAQ